MKLILEKIKNIIKSFRNSYQLNDSYKPKFRVNKIEKNEYDRYIILIQVIYTNKTFYAFPEEILANDNLVDKFSPRDVRTMTYLGYLAINQPEYKILAQRFSENTSLFVLSKKGQKKPIIKTIDEIIKETEIFNKMHPQDAKEVGLAIANNEFSKEKLKLNEEMKIIKNDES